jgi:oligopeptide/dipeptide ABC transporter ATP-binding protein
MPPVHAQAPLLRAHDLAHEYVMAGASGTQKRVVRALCGVSLDIGPAEIVGVVGETGSGKSTLARALLQLPRPKSGTVTYNGVDLTQLRGRELRRACSGMQMVFQDPFASLNPQWKIRSIVEEPIRAQGVLSRAERERRGAQMLDLVGLDPSVYADRRPHQLSGGQLQRVAIARALAVAPRLLICDEPTSSLDVLLQKQLITLLKRLHAELHFALVFISHDIALVAQLSDRVAVMHRGQLCEVGPRELLVRAPGHPYTAELVKFSRQPLAAWPGQGPGQGDGQPRQKAAVFRAQAGIEGCRFQSSCALATTRCAEEAPRLTCVSPSHSVACHHPLPQPAHCVDGVPNTANTA